MYYLLFFLALLIYSYGIINLMVNPKTWNKLILYTVMGFGGIILALWAVLKGNLR